MTFYIAIEGPDKSGKETQSKLLKEWLREREPSSAVEGIEVPVKDRATYGTIYSMLKSGAAKRHPYLFQLLQFANKRLWQEVDMWRYKTYKYVVLDRWSLSSVVYGTAEGLPHWFVDFLYRRLFQPDLTIVFSGKSYDREGESDVYEDDMNLQLKVRNLYAKIANNPDLHSIIKIDNTGTVEEVHELVKAAVLKATGNA
jgi:dTMP kinase